MSQQILTHAPTLTTIRMVEEAIKNAKNSIMTIPELKRSLPKQVNHTTLKTILEYLEESNKIYMSIKGITWLSPMTPALREMIKNGKEL